MAKPPANVCDGLTPMKTGNSNESLHLDPACRLCSSNREWDPPVPAHSLFHDEEWSSSQQLTFPRDVVFPYFLLSFSFSSLSLHPSHSLHASLFFYPLLWLWGLTYKIRYWYKAWENMTEWALLGKPSWHSVYMHIVSGINLRLLLNGHPARLIRKREEHQG